MMYFICILGLNDNVETGLLNIDDPDHIAPS